MKKHVLDSISISGIGIISGIYCNGETTIKNKTNNGNKNLKQNHFFIIKSKILVL